MRLLGRYIFREILTSAVLGTLLASFILFLRSVDPIFELLVKSSSANTNLVLQLFALAIPNVLPFTIPFGVLVGILIGLGRLASDGEIIAMRAAGVSSRKVIFPVLLFAALGGGVAAFATLRLTPYSIHKYTDIVNQLEATQLTADVPSRVFVENFPNTILYVGEVKPGNPSVWKNVFVADVAPPEKRSAGMRDKAMGPMITVAEQAIAVPDVTNNRLQLTLRNYSTHEMSKDLSSRDTIAPTGQQALTASPPSQTPLRSIGMGTRQLLAYPRGKPDWVEYQIELHKRFALPVACIMLAMVGIPLGIATRKGGRSAGYVNAIFVAFFCYYMGFVSLIGLARQKTLPVPVALWLPNAVFFVVGVIFLARLELPGDKDYFGDLRGRVAVFFRALKARVVPEDSAGLGGWRIPLLPQLVDTYILSNFVTYLVLMLASFVSLELIRNFFELINDMLRNNISLKIMFKYLFFLSPQLIYQMLPVSILVAVLAAFGVMSKQNEITAFKACGVSLFRLAAPILVGSVLLSGGLFAFDFYYVANANRIQDALRDQIKGRATQTYLRPDRTWKMGYDSLRIFNYRYFDNSGEESTMSEASVFELEPKTFRLQRQIFARQAHWNASLKTWVFEDGWTCEYKGPNCDAYARFQATTFRELTEPPDYFLKEARKDEQMNFLQLDSYIKDLTQSGFEGTSKLQVRFYRKFSLPLFALIMALIAVPFGFLVGSRGAMTGIGISIGIAVAYIALGQLFEKVGDVNLLSPATAAWAPDVVFALAGTYLFLRMKS
uniref:Permease YjgP/YjgQ family protein n=1 Tax=Solibacter usitatus (strain Ellin6076) TaxID=234267 RepID=Q01UA2_SOLUE